MGGNMGDNMYNFTYFIQIGTIIELKLQFDPIPTQNFDPNPINRVPDPKNLKKYIKNHRNLNKYKKLSINRLSG